jgi:outer membrane protein insertion porin family
MLSARSKKISLLVFSLWLGSLGLSGTTYAQVADNNTVPQQEDDEYELDYDGDDEAEPEQEPQTLKIIRKIIVEGNTHVPTDAIVSRIPYREGDLFEAQKTNALLRSVYALGSIKHVQVFGQDVDENHMDLIVAVREKNLLEKVRFSGNYHLPEKDIKKKFNYSEIRAIDEEDIQKYVGILKRLYREKDYHNVEITPDYVVDGDKASLTFTIKEHNKSLVKRVFFKGNTYFSGKKLRSLIFTREDWILGFLDRSGSYQPEAIEADKRVIENYYQSNGFLNARVIDAQVELSPNKQEVAVTFCIQEGDQYTISDIKVPGNTILSEEVLRTSLPIKVGDLYSKDKIRSSIETLRLLWGESGYIYADIEPSIQPNEETKTVELGFYSELGPQVYLNRVSIFGNRKTHDKIIRRLLTVKEGSMLTTKAMDDSKSRVEGLGYFDPRSGVNWKINRLTKDRADLDLIVKEVKTGRFEYQMGIGGSPSDFSSPMKSFNIKVALFDTNFIGRGIHLNLSAEYSKEERTLLFSLTDPWLFDRPIQGGFDLYIKRAFYDDFTFIEGNDIKEQIAGGGFTLGFLWARFFESSLAFRLGVEGITYKQKPVIATAPGVTPEDRIELQRIFDQRFASGDFVWLGISSMKDIRNHPMHPSRGYQWLAQTKAVIPGPSKDTNKGYGFLKLDFDGSWYTPLIGERDLVFGLHSHLGLIMNIDNYKIPFRELYNVGGPASVRGFLFGEIGPNWVTGPGDTKRNALGGKKAFWLNAELIFPITGDFGIKGCFFYDGGAGWDTPGASQINKAHLRNNNFNYRQAVGFGIRMLRPTPMRIDWGFKLDRRNGERVSEVHFGGYHEF